MGIVSFFQLYLKNGVTGVTGVTVNNDAGFRVTPSKKQGVTSVTNSRDVTPVTPLKNQSVTEIVNNDTAVTPVTPVTPKNKYICTENGKNNHAKP